MMNEDYSINEEVFDSLSPSPPPQWGRGEGVGVRSIKRRDKKMYFNINFIFDCSLEEGLNTAIHFMEYFFAFF